MYVDEGTRCILLVTVHCCCRRESLLKFASESRPRLASLEEFKWRVDVGISTRSTAIA